MTTRQLGTDIHPETCWKGCKRRTGEAENTVFLEKCIPGARGYPGFVLRCIGCDAQWFGKTPDKAWDARIVG